MRGGRGRLGQRSSGRAARGNGRAGRGEGAAGRGPPLVAWMCRPHMEEPDGWTFEVACKKCGIIRHPQGRFRKCPVGVCHVCCRRSGQRGVGGCSVGEGEVFFRELLKQYGIPEEMIDGAWADWKIQVGL